MGIFLKQRKIIIICALLALLAFSFSACSFTEEEGEPKEDFSFLYLGDPQSDPESGEGYRGWQMLLEQAVEDDSDLSFLIAGGDLVNDGDDAEEWEAFFSAKENALGKLPLYPVPGNHTTKDSLYPQLFDLPKNGPEGFEETFYSFDYGNVHFLMLDSNLLGSLDAETAAQLSGWIEKDLKQAERSLWKIAVMHHPMYPIAAGEKDAMRAETMQQNYLPVLEKQGVDLILCGHQHLYARTFPMQKGSISDHGIVQIMGVSGGKSYAAKEVPFVEKLLCDVPVYTIISITAAESAEDGARKSVLSIKTSDAEGTVLDTAQWEKILDGNRR